MKHVFKATKLGWEKEKEGIWFDSDDYTAQEAKDEFKPYEGTTQRGYSYTGYEYDGQKYHDVTYLGEFEDPPSFETISPFGSPRISISAVPSDIRNSAVNTFRWNQQTSETSVIERVLGNPHQDKSHRRTRSQMAILLNMGGSCSYLYPSI